MRKARRLAAVITLPAAVYAVAAWWFLSRYPLPSIRPVGAVLLFLAVISQLGGKAAFGEMFRDGVIEMGGRLSFGGGLRAALVGAGVSRLIPVGGVVTPVAMAWTVRGQTNGAAGAAVRATTLNYAGLLIVTGGAVLLADARELPGFARPGLAVIGALLALAGGGLIFGSSRLRSLSQVFPSRLRRRFEHVLVDHGADARTHLLLWARMGLETAALWAVLAAFRIDLSPLEALAAFGATQLLAGLPGTPGGAGYAEAGLVGVLAAFGFPPSVSVGPTLVYRIVSYWLPAGAGLLAGGLTFIKQEASSS